MKKLSIMVLDTETCDLAGSVYDVGYTITNKKGDILAARNWLVEEIFTDPKKMMGAFYAKKLFTHYAPMLEQGEINIVPWETIIQGMREDIAEYQVNVLAAYNLAFDRRVMQNTHALLGDGAPIFGKVKQLCLWRFACETKLNQKTYKKLALEQGWVSEAGNIRTGAEYAYRFCAGDWGFIEDHTALSDALIETEIMSKCFSARKRIPWDNIKDKYRGAPWRIPNTDLISHV